MLKANRLIHIFILLFFSLHLVLLTEFDEKKLPNSSEGSDYQDEENEQEILTDVKDLGDMLEIFPKVFLYITKDNCDYCRTFDPVFEDAFRIIQKDQTCKY